MKGPLNLAAKAAESWERTGGRRAFLAAGTVGAKTNRGKESGWGLGCVAAVDGNAKAR